MKRVPLKQGDKIKLNNQEYTVDTVIGDGATCIVYSAYYEDNLGLPHRVNIKECYPYNADIVRYGNTLVWKSDTERVQNLSAFSTAYKKLMSTQKGNFVVHAFNIDKYNETLYIVMDANDGVTFDNDNADNLVDILKTLKLLAYVVGEYHKSGYLHLDIKPSNFLVYPRPSDHTILFDMDTITPIEDIKSGQVKVCSYSEDWAAPEQKQGKISKLCPATDIYAIGAVLFEKVMGRQVECGDSCLFTEWDFEGELFENVNPRIKRLLRNIFRKTLSANIKRRYQNAYELIKDLEEAIKVASCDVYLKGDDICCSGCFFGRETELTLIKEHFDSKRKAVFLHGFGGIGKTEIARRYAEINSNYYDTVLFIKYNGNDTLQELLNDIDIVNFDTNDSKEKWRKLRSLIDEHTLVIVDNFDVEVGADNGLKVLFETKAHILIATRTDFTSVYNGDKYAYIKIKELATNELEQVFVTNAKITAFTDSDRETLKKIFKLIEHHTFATELLAKQMWYSGWTIEELYQKVKSGFASLENVERITANKDENTVKEKSLNILRAVYNLTDLNEDRKQVLRNLYLLGFMDVSINIFKKYSAAGTKDIETLNDLVEIGLVHYDSSFYTLHPLIEELINKDMPPTNDNCSNFYVYVNSKIFNTCNYYSSGISGGDADEFEFENDCEFLCAFFYRSNLADSYNRSLLINWLLGIIENEDAELGCPQFSFFSKIYNKMSKVAVKEDVSATERYNIYFILLCAWLTDFHWFYPEDMENHQHFRDDNFQKHLRLCVDSCNQLDDTSKEECLDKVYETIIKQVMEYFIARKTILCDVIKNVYFERPHLFSDMDAYDKDKLGLPLSEEEKVEIDNFTKSMPEAFKPDYTNDEIELELSIKEGFYNSNDKVKFIKDIISNETYSPIKRAELIWYCTDAIFDRLCSGYLRNIDIKWDWSLLEQILDLEEAFLISDECDPKESEDIQNWNHYIETNTVNKIIVYVATNNYPEYEDYFDILLKEIGRRISVWMKHDHPWERFIKIKDFNTMSLYYLNNALTTLKKAHLMLPYLLRYLNGWQEYARTINCDDERVFFPLYKVIAECAELASAEIVYSEKYLLDFNKIEFEYSSKMDDIAGIDYSLKFEED